MQASEGQALRWDSGHRSLEPTWSQSERWTPASSILVGLRALGGLT